MFLFYVDESGTPEIPGVSDHFVLAAIGIPVDKWTKCDKQINQLKTSYSLSDAEIHVGWMVRHYKEQEDIENFVENEHLLKEEKLSQSCVKKLFKSAKQKEKTASNIKRTTLRQKTTCTLLTMKECVFFKNYPV